MAPTDDLLMLYKYVTFERKDILENQLIRFTQPGCFNDPFEMHPSFDLMSKAGIVRCQGIQDEKLNSAMLAALGQELSGKSQRRRKGREIGR